MLKSQSNGAKAKAEFESRMKGRKYTTLIPEKQKPPASIR